MGALFRMRAVECSDLPAYLSALAGRGRRVLGAALRDGADEFRGEGLDPSDVAVIGNEGHGLSDGAASSCTSFIKIPMNGFSESLNAGVAASVIMWEYSKISRNNYEK